MENLKVMIIEDERIIALHLESLLRKMGCNVLGIFDSGEEAVDAFQELNPELMFVDIRLNGEMTGIDAVRKIKEITDLPVIYITSNSDPNTISEAKITAPSAFLKKPFDEIQLRATIEVSLHKEQLVKTEISNLNEGIKMRDISIHELNETNAHLVTATWRERELKQELQKTKEIIEEQNKKILDSINYAKRIQKAIIPVENDLAQALGEHFMFYKAKDVVSGDFPWLFVKDDYVYIAAVDCTGHGVPGAMMSLIGYLLLNDIVNNQGYATPSEILNKLHHAVVKTLKQDVEGNKAADGMDIGLCRIHKETGEVVYSGAHRPLYHYINGEVEQYKGDKYPIGGMQYKGENTFTDSTIHVKSGESIYVFSDGLPDQFGGPEKLKFGSKRIRKLIAANGDKSMQEVKGIFYDEFNTWQADNKQMDDVLLIGMKF